MSDKPILKLKVKSFTLKPVERQKKIKQVEKVVKVVKVEKVENVVKVEPVPFTLKRIDLPSGRSWILSGRMPDELLMDADTYQSLWSIHPEEYNTIIMRGKPVKTPRWQQSYGQAYYYTGLMHEALPVEHPYLKKIMAWVNKHSGACYKQLLINWYKDGSHYIGAHSDDETQLVPGSSIYSFSFGQQRTFRVTSKADESNKKLPAAQKFKLDIPLKNNHMVVMCGDMQRECKHAVPKRALSTAPGTRINITLRLFSSS